MKSKLLGLLLFTLPLVAQATNPCGGTTPHCTVLSWTDTTNTSWNVYRAPGSCGGLSMVWAKLTTTALTVIGYIDTSVIAATTYCYAVTGILGGIESTPSNMMVVTIPPNNNVVDPTNATATSH